MKGVRADEEMVLNDLEYVVSIIECAVVSEFYNRFICLALSDSTYIPMKM